MYIGHRIGFALTAGGADARNIRWPICIINSVDKTKFSSPNFVSLRNSEGDEVEKNDLQL